MAWTSMELFDRVLREEEITRADIELMVQAHVAEDLNLDWKGGKVVNDKSGGATIRKAVAGFANAEGGVLVLGVNGGDAGTGEKKWTMALCPKTKGKQSTKEWVEQILVQLRASLRPLPRIVVIDDGELILIGVQRSDLLVQVVEGSEGVVHYLRFYGSTQKVPGYLLADLLLGRRQRPRIDLAVTAASVGPRTPSRAGEVHAMLSADRRYQSEMRDPWPYRVTLTARNTGLVWADEVACGAVVIGEAADDRRDAQGRRVEASMNVPGSVLDNITRRHRVAHDLDHVFYRFKDMAPFEKFELVTLDGFLPSMSQLPQQHGPYRITYWAPVYVVCRNATPMWYQLRVVYDENARVIPEHCSCEPADGHPRIDITVEIQPPGLASQWVEIEGFGRAPLALVSREG